VTDRPLPPSAAEGDIRGYGFVGIDVVKIDNEFPLHIGEGKGRGQRGGCQQERLGVIQNQGAGISC